MSIDGYTVEQVSEALNEINRKLKYHPGDAPWLCTKCYNGNPCVERDILKGAKSYFTGKALIGAALIAEREK